MARQYGFTSDGTTTIDFADSPKGRAYFDNQDSGNIQQPGGIKDLFLMLKEKVEALEDGDAICVKIARSDDGRSWKQIQELLDDAE